MPARVDGEVRSLDPIAIVEDALSALASVPDSKAVTDIIAHAYLPSLRRFDLRALPHGLCHGDP
jgi:hypothetical protein